MYFSIPGFEENSHNMDDTLHDQYAEFDPIKKVKLFPMEIITTELETEIFISKEKVTDGDYLDLSIVYTPYRSMFLIYNNLIYLCKSNVTNIYQVLSGLIINLQIARRWILRNTDRLDVTFAFGRNTCAI